MKKLMAAALALGVCVYSAHTAWSSSDDKRVSKFSIHSHGIRIGDASSTCSRGEDNTVVFSNSTRIDANFIVRSYSLDSKEHAIVGKNGTVSYSRTSQENGKSTVVKGVLVNGHFKLHITESGSKRSRSIPQSEYDSTTMECPETLLNHVGEKKSIRLLDLENLEVVKRNYTWVRNEDVRIAGKTFNCRVIDFEDKNKKCRRWIRPDDVGVMVARQDGSGKAGTYSVRMVDYKSGS